MFVRAIKEKGDKEIQAIMPFASCIHPCPDEPCKDTSTGIQSPN